MTKSSGLGFSFDMLFCACPELGTATAKKAGKRVELRLRESGSGVGERIGCIVERVYDPTSKRPGLVAANRACMEISNPRVQYNQRLVTGLAIGGGFLPVHASAVTGESGALVFLGKSGSGKTTIGERLLADRPLIHDDRIVIDPGETDQKPSVLGSRLLHSKRKKNTADRIPISGLFILCKSDCCGVEVISPAHALYWLIASRPSGVEFNLDSLLGIAAGVLERIPIFLLSFNLDENEVKRTLLPFLGS